MTVERKICPRCGNRSMVKKIVGNGKYRLVCEVCNYMPPELSEDTGPDVV